jgi:hypothetical protein
MAGVMKRKEELNRSKGDLQQKRRKTWRERRLTYGKNKGRPVERREERLTCEEKEGRPEEKES